MKSAKSRLWPLHRTHKAALQHTANERQGGEGRKLRRSRGFQDAYRKTQHGPHLGSDTDTQTAKVPLGDNLGALNPAWVFEDN